ncbi:MAG: alpha/beta fold hydrolase [Anaerolineae bacterium]|nr:alpha/beta fold hydrolase [Anaerolineae bacterium]
MATVVLPESTRALYPFAAHYYTLSDGKRMHYLDEGPPNGEVLVFLHGYPTWSFTYRALIVYYAALGYRCIAPDFIGFGLSDKPADKAYHTLRHHIHNTLEYLNVLRLRDITLIMEDWGGPLGLTYTLRRQETVKRLVLMNTWVFQDTLPNRLHPLVNWATRPGFGELIFGRFNLAFDLVLQRWSNRQLSEAVLMAYKAPFRDLRERAALIQFPRMISTTPDHPSAQLMREIESGLDALKRMPTLLLWGEADPAFPLQTAEHWKTMLPRAKGPIVLPQARHFLVEDAPEAVTRHLDQFLEATR